MSLYHYTCDHGRHGIGDEGQLLPVRQLVQHPARLWTGDYVWMTDLALPLREGLGLTSTILTCDRTAHRYVVTDEATVKWWPLVARTLPQGCRDIELAPGARPAHWYVSLGPVPAMYDPAAARTPDPRHPQRE